MEPMLSMPSTFAPPCVAQWMTSSTVVAAGPLSARCVYQQVCTSEIESPDSLDAEPSTPIDTGAPARASSGAGAMPLPSLQLEAGQCAVPVPVSAIMRISDSVVCTMCANQTSGPSQSWSATNSTGLRSYFSRQNTT